MLAVSRNLRASGGDTSGAVMAICTFTHLCHAQISSWWDLVLYLSWNAYKNVACWSESSAHQDNKGLEHTTPKGRLKEVHFFSSGAI